MTLSWTLSLATPGWFLPVDAAAHGAGMDRQMALNLWIALALLLGLHVALSIGLTLRRRFRTKLFAALFEYLPLALLTLMFAWLTLRAERLWAATRYTGAAPGALQVEATGMQFAWYFRYPGKDFAAEGAGCDPWVCRAGVEIEAECRAGPEFSCALHAHCGGDLCGDLYSTLRTGALPHGGSASRRFARRVRALAGVEGW